MEFVILCLKIFLINQIICVNLLNALFLFLTPPIFLFRLACPFIPCCSALELTSLKKNGK